MNTITASIRLRKLERNEKIELGDLHSFGEHYGVSFRPIMNQSTIGQTPSNFSKDREFWRMIFD